MSPFWRYAISTPYIVAGWTTADARTAAPTIDTTRETYNEIGRGVDTMATISWYSDCHRNNRKEGYEEVHDCARGPGWSVGVYMEASFGNVRSLKSEMEQMD
jgi:hypothetical protein